MTDDREYGKAYPVAKAIVKPVTKVLWRIHTTGMHNVPEDGAAIFCPNHISFFDSIVLPAVLPRRISYVGKAEYLDSWKTKYIFPAVGMIPIDRGGGSASQRALDTAARVLGRGEFFGIYPEGTRSRDGVLHRGRTGAARLALRTGAPIIPVGICGTDLIQPAGASVPRPFTSCQVNIGAPIDVTRYLDRQDDHMLLRQLTDEVMYEIRKLSGQEYVDTYAGSKPEQPPAEVAAEPAPAPSPEPARVPVLPDGSVADDRDDDNEILDVRASSADVLAQWWS
ncbi:lysophospholipid acyltransferase family protein [Actinospongicola halichondriae]|uniref:lysophospholipid acyltransferase family protein n=1 Tax=Actinospongicola halichondriae TaxID=3236844 RepID=UPI003D4B3245